MKIIFKQSILALVLFMFTNIIFAQEINISGIVTNASDGATIPGVSIIVKGSAHGTITDANGKYIIKVPSDSSVLIYSFIGYKKAEVLVNQQTEINVSMKKDFIGLDEVVVVGYGTQKVKDITGSLSHLSIEEIEDRPILQFSDALAGKASGVQVISPSGKPQKGSFLRIRGTTSIDASSEPLYVIDGVPTSGLYALNPNDIESISILKDASAAAIYGASGANGVVIINTKRGSTDKPKVEYNSYFGYSKVSKKMDVLNADQYIGLMDELGLTTDWSNYTENTNWQDEIFRKGGIQNYQLSVAGTEENTNYYISGNWSKQNGVVRKNIADRYGAKINFDQHINKWLKASISIMYSRWHDIDIADNKSAGRAGVILGSISTPPVIGIFNEDGTYTGNPLQSSWENPVASTDAPKQDYYDSRFLGYIYFEAKVIEGLKFKTSMAADNSNEQYNYFLDPYLTDWGRANNGIAEESVSKSRYWINENMLIYNKIFGLNNLKMMGGFIISKNQNRSIWAGSTNFANEAIITINGGSIISGISSSFSEWSNVSYVSRVNYDYANKYLLTVNFRTDASSVFGPSNQWGYFPSFSIGWRLSEESFLNNSGFFDDLKLRFGWGQVGNDRIAPYSWYGTVGPGYDYVIGNVPVAGIAPETLENQDLKWETTSQTDLGIDMAFFDTRINIVADVYLKNTSDLLLSMPIPASTGFLSSIQNIGEIQNKGIEFLVSSKNLINEVKWSTDFNISFNRNKVIDIKEQVIMTGSIYQRGNVAIAMNGESLGSFWGFVSKGVDPETGDMIYKDLDGDTLITAEGDKMIIGDANPKFIYGLNNTVSYKGFGISIFIQGVYGNDIFNASRVETESMNDFKNQLATVSDRWQTPGDKTEMPRSTLGSKFNSDLSSRFIENGSYLRIKTLSFSYNLPVKILNKIRISSARIYLTCENLFTFTEYSGFDPEVSAFDGHNLAQGIDFGTYPQSKSYILGINLTF